MLERAPEQRAQPPVERLAKIEEANYLAELRPERVDLRGKGQCLHEIAQRRREGGLGDERARVRRVLERSAPGRISRRRGGAPPLFTHDAHAIVAARVALSSKAHLLA